MNHFGVSYEVAYRHEQLQRTALRRRSTDSTRHQRRWWFARRRTTMPKPSAPPAPLTLTVPAVGTAEFVATPPWTLDNSSRYAKITTRRR